MSIFKPALVASAGLLALTLCPQAQANPWKIDTAHSSADFAVRHLMISNVKGHFSKVDGTIDYDGKNIKGLKVDSQIDIASVDTGDKGRDEHLKSADFFDAAKFPQMTFKSKKVKSAGKGKFVLTGDLTIKGITQPITFRATADAKSASAEIKVDRTKYGIKYGSGSFFDNLGDKAIDNDFVLNVSLVTEAAPKAAVTTPTKNT